MIEKPVASGETTPLTAAEKAPASPASAPPATNASEAPAAAIDAERGGDQRRFAQQARALAEPAAEEMGIEQRRRRSGRARRSPAAPGRAATVP